MNKEYLIQHDTLVSIAETIRKFNNDFNLTLPNMTPGDMAESIETLRHFTTQTMTFVINEACYSSLGIDGTLYFLNPYGYTQTIKLSEAVGQSLKIKAYSVVACDKPIFGHGQPDRGNGLIINDCAMVLRGSCELIPEENAPQ